MMVLYGLLPGRVHVGMLWVEMESGATALQHESNPGGHDATRRRCPRRALTREQALPSESATAR